MQLFGIIYVVRKDKGHQVLNFCNVAFLNPVTLLGQKPFFAVIVGCTTDYNNLAVKKGYLGFVIVIKGVGNVMQANSSSSITGIKIAFYLPTKVVKRRLSNLPFRGNGYVGGNGGFGGKLAAVFVKPAEEIKALADGCGKRRYRLAAYYFK